MRDLFQEQLNELKRELTVMGASCEEIIALASQALTGWDGKLAQKVNTIGGQIDESERTVETICMKLLLRQQPVARDLRQISAALKMITDMERIGDQAEDIVEIVPFMNAHPDEKYPKIREMAKAAQVMVTEAVDAYVKQDLELARKVMAHDDVVDDYFTQVKTIKSSSKIVVLLKCLGNCCIRLLIEMTFLLASMICKIVAFAVARTNWLLYKQ